jgi:hypothetical protein
MPIATVSNPNVSASLSADVAADQLAGTVRHAVADTPAAGTNAGEINVAVSRNVTVTSGANQTIDLTALPDAAGSNRTLVSMTHWAFENQSDIAGQIFTIGGGANPAIATGEVVNPSGGFVMKCDPLNGQTIDATHKNILISVAAGSNVPGVLTVWGRTA